MQNNRGTYKTKQKELILSFLDENKGRHITVDMIAEALKGRVGQTTVYRCMDRLVNDGVVLKYDMPDGMGSCFQYVETDNGCAGHYHFLCVGCGRVIHEDCHHLDELMTHVKDEHRFKVDNLKTILYGSCEECVSRTE